MNKGVEMASVSCDSQENTINHKKSKLHAATQAALAFFLASCSNITGHKNQEVVYSNYEITPVVAETTTQKIDTQTIEKPQEVVSRPYSVEYFYDVDAGWASIHHDGQQYIVSINTYALEAISQDYNINQSTVESTYLNNEIGSGAFAHYFSEKWNSVVYNKEVGEMAGDLNTAHQILQDLSVFDNNEYTYEQLQQKVDEVKTLLVLLKFKKQDVSVQDYYGASLQSLENNFKKVFKWSMSVKNLDQIISNISYISVEDQLATFKQLQQMYKGVQDDMKSVLQQTVAKQELSDYFSMNPNTFMQLSNDQSHNTLIAKN